MAKFLPVLLIILVAVLSVSRATLEPGEREALVAIRTHLPSLQGYWPDDYLAALCPSVSSSYQYFVACEDGHVGGLYAQSPLIPFIVLCFL